MKLFHGSRAYEILLAGSPGGMTLELALVGGVVGPIAQVVYADRDGSMRFSAFEEDVPLALIEALVSNAREALTPAVPGDQS
jgi:hypothetical protein